jgi:hypothetical protein
MQQVAESPVKVIPKWFRMDDPTKLCNSFEFGPAWWIHLPMKLFGIYWGIRLRNFGFFAATNPGLENGGLFDYSKSNAMQQLDAANLPKSVKVQYPYFQSEIMRRLELAEIRFPIVAKPDFGERGREVEFLENPEALKDYLADKKQGNYILQEKLEEELEFGVFYSKNPKSGLSQITSLTLKIPLQVVGDGKYSVETLILNHTRARRYPQEINFQHTGYVPESGEVVKLSQKGNHCKGAVFLDCSEFIDAELVGVFERICKPITGFFYGRLDVKVDSFKDLWDKKNVKVIEVNGCNSEPIHIYSPGNTYVQAIKSIKDHFSIMAGIAKFNLETKKYQPDISKLWSNYLNFRKSRKL